jgi:hypothetical protein
MPLLPQQVSRHNLAADDKGLEETQHRSAQCGILSARERYASGRPAEAHSFRVLRFPELGRHGVGAVGQLPYPVVAEEDRVGHN